MVMNFIDYKYDPTAGFVSSGSNAISVGATIVLPLPMNLEDSVNVNSNRAQLGLTGTAAYALMNMSNESMKRSGSATYNALKEVMNDTSSLTDIDSYLSTARVFGSFVGRAGLDNISPGAGLAADLTTGTAVNPHTTLDFDGVALKSHTFNWTLAPRNERESSSLNSIIRTIKRNMLPNYQGIDGIVPRALLTYPKLVKISLLGIDQDYFYFFKPGLINSLNTQYSQGNGTTMLKGGRPGVITLQMAFTEAQIHVASDYSDNIEGE
jgi:hypothetical protein